MLPDEIAYKLQDAKAFLEKHAKYSLDLLLPKLENSFYRITLVNKKKTERITIDANLAFCNPSDGVEKQMDDLVIIELKQTGFMPSFAKSILSDMHVHPVKFSKYCIGTILTAPDVKYNRFKERIIQLNRIRKQQYGFV